MGLKTAPNVPTNGGAHSKKQAPLNFDSELKKVLGQIFGKSVSGTDSKDSSRVQAPPVTPYLFDTIRLGHVAVVGALLEIGGPELPTATDGGESCLAVSVRFQRAGLVGALLEAAGPRKRELLVMSCL